MFHPHPLGGSSRQLSAARTAAAHQSGCQEFQPHPPNRVKHRLQEGCSVRCLTSRLRSLPREGVTTINSMHVRGICHHPLLSEGRGVRQTHSAGCVPCTPPTTLVSR